MRSPHRPDADHMITHVKQGLGSLKDIKEIPQEVQGLEVDENRITKISQNDALSFKNISYLSISANCLNSLSFLQYFPSLKFIDISRNFLTRLDGIEANQLLKEINVNENKIEDFVIESPIQSLNIISAQRNNLKKMPDLSVFPNLLAAYFDENYISDISNLISLSIQKLSLESNYINNFKPFSLDTLQDLDLSYNNITSFQPFTQFLNLTSLKLVGNPINDLSDSKDSLINLQILDISYTKITDCSNILYFAPNLVVLNVSHTKISDIHTITKYLNSTPYIKSIDIRYTPLTAQTDIPDDDTTKFSSISDVNQKYPDGSKQRILLRNEMVKSSRSHIEIINEIPVTNNDILSSSINETETSYSTQTQIQSQIQRHEEIKNYEEINDRLKAEIAKAEQQQAHQQPFVQPPPLIPQSPKIQPMIQTQPVMQPQPVIQTQPIMQPQPVIQTQPQQKPEKIVIKMPPQAVSSPSQGGQPQNVIINTLPAAQSQQPLIISYPMMPQPAPGPEKTTERIIIKDKHRHRHREKDRDRDRGRRKREKEAIEDNPMLREVINENKRLRQQLRYHQEMEALSRQREADRAREAEALSRRREEEALTRQREEEAKRQIEAENKLKPKTKSLESEEEKPKDRRKDSVMKLVTDLAIQNAELAAVYQEGSTKPRKRKHSGRREKRKERQRRARRTASSWSEEDTPIYADPVDYGDGAELTEGRSGRSEKPLRLTHISSAGYGRYDRMRFNYMDSISTLASDSDAEPPEPYVQRPRPQYPFTQKSPRRLPWDFDGYEIVETRKAKTPPAPKVLTQKKCEDLIYQTFLRTGEKESVTDRERDFIKFWLDCAASPSTVFVKSIKRAPTSSKAGALSGGHLKLVLMRTKNTLAFFALPIDPPVHLLRTVRKAGGYLLCAADIGHPAENHHVNCLPNDDVIYKLRKFGFDSIAYDYDGERRITILDSNKVVPLFAVEFK